jgi:hypothetical protein
LQRIDARLLALEEWCNLPQYILQHINGGCDLLQHIVQRTDDSCDLLKNILSGTDADFDLRQYILQRIDTRLLALEGRGHNLRRYLCRTNLGLLADGWRDLPQCILCGTDASL